MRIAHTSDWHIGRTLHGVDLHEYHAQYFDHLAELVRSESIDAVVVSGDVYDRAIPPVDSVQLLSDTLARLADITQVVLTPGNHDSAIRLGFASQIMRPEIHMLPTVRGISRPVTITGTLGEELLVYGIPYLDPDSSRGELSRCGGTEHSSEHGATFAQGESSTDQVPAKDNAMVGRSHESVMKAAMKLMRSDYAARQKAHTRSLVMAHAFVVGGIASDSERDIRVGGVDSVPAGVFSGVDYVALGHLHGAQKVAVPDAVARYSGSPLAYSFSEMNHKKSTAIVTIGADGVSQEPELIAAPVPRKLSDLTGSMADILGEQGDAHVDNWLRVTVTDPLRPTDMNARLKAKFPHALVMQHQPIRSGTRDRESIVVTAQANPSEVAAQFVQDVTTVPATAEETAVLTQAIDRARAAERSA